MKLRFLIALLIIGPMILQAQDEKGLSSDYKATYSDLPAMLPYLTPFFEEEHPPKPENFLENFLHKDLLTVSKDNKFLIETSFRYDSNARIIDDNISLDMGKFSFEETKQIFLQTHYERVFKKHKDFNMLFRWDMVYINSSEKKISESDPLWMRFELPAVFKRKHDEIHWGLAYESLLRKSREFPSHRGPYWHGLEFFSRSFYRLSRLELATYFQVQQYKSYVSEKKEEERKDGLNYFFQLQATVDISRNSRFILPLSFSFHRANEESNRYSRYDFGLFYEFDHHVVSSRIGLSRYKLSYEEQKNDADDSLRAYFDFIAKIHKNFSVKLSLNQIFFDKKKVCEEDEDDSDCGKTKDFDKKQMSLGFIYQVKF